jgi:hypothetical protein
MPRRADRPDIELGAAVKAKKLRFDRVPDADVRCGRAWRSVTERKNLSPEAEPGVTYRDVDVRWHAVARVAAQGLEYES